MTPQRNTVRRTIRAKNKKVKASDGRGFHSTLAAAVHSGWLRFWQCRMYLPNNPLSKNN